MRQGDCLLGFGAALDREVRWDAGVLEDLAEGHHLRPEDLAMSRTIRTERDLVCSVLDFMAHGTGGERWVSSPGILSRFSDRFAGTTSLGGTCVRAAAAMQHLGVASTVHLSYLDEQLRQLLPEDLGHLVGNRAEPSYPHLIVQYPMGATVRTRHLHLEAPAANRIIFVNDPANERLILSPLLKRAVAESQVFLISGMNAMRDPRQVCARLRYVEECVEPAPRPRLVVYEDAGFHEPEVANLVRTHMAKLVDVYSLSDEELSQAIDGRVDLLVPDSVHQAVAELARRLNVPTLVVHTRRWALAYGPDVSRWERALTTGVALAGARFLHGDQVTEETVRDVAAMAPGRATADFVAGLTALAGDRAVVVPVPTLGVTNPTTVGLGDTFIGGFLAACSDPSAAIAPRREPRRPRDTHLAGP